MAGDLRVSSEGSLHCRHISEDVAPVVSQYRKLPSGCDILTRFADGSVATESLVGIYEKSVAIEAVEFRWGGAGIECASRD